MADDVQIADTSSGDAPHDYIVPSSADFILKAAYGVFDGTSASGNFLPAIEIVSDSGHTVARSVGQQVTAGDSAEVSWFPFAPPVSSGGGGGLTAAWESFWIGNVTPGAPLPITNGTSASIIWDNIFGSLLDYSDARRPAVISAGMYALMVTAEVAWPATITQGGSAFMSVILSGANASEFNGQTTFTYPTSPGSGSGSWQFRFVAPLVAWAAGDSFFVTIGNEDGAHTVDFGAFGAISQIA